MSRVVACLGDFSRDRQGLWLPKDDLKDSSSWSSTPSVLLRDIHNDLLTNYDYKDSAPPPTQSGPRVRPGHNSENGVSQQEEVTPLFIPQLNRLHESYIVRGEDTSNVSVAVIPVQKTRTHQFAVSRRAEAKCHVRVISIAS